MILPKSGDFRIFIAIRNMGDQVVYQATSHLKIFSTNAV